MKLVKCLAVAAIALAACKKDDSKPAAASASASGSGSASASASGSASASASGTAIASAAPKTPPAAMAGFATIAKTETKAANGMAAGAGGGIGGALGGLFGAGAPQADAPAPPPPTTDKPDTKPTDQPTGGDDAPADEDNSGYDLSKIVFPPAGTKGGDCNAVADRIMLMVTAIIDDQIKQLPPAQQKMAKEMAGKEMRDSMVQACTDEKWSQDLRDCVLTAMDQKSLQACEKMAPQGGAPPAESPDTDEPAKPAPAWTGGNACADVGARMKQLAEAQIGDLPADQKGQVDSQLDAQVKDLVDTCAQGGWTDAQRTCIVQASTLDAAGGCLGGS